VHIRSTGGEHCAETVGTGGGAWEENRLLAVSPLPRQDFVATPGNFGGGSTGPDQIFWA
jgi:hypothetical protein